MFAKKEFAFQSQYDLPDNIGHPYSQDTFKGKNLNHDFFLLVRDQHYQQAYLLGQIILKSNPYNQAVSNFMDFIQNNTTDLKKMVQYEREYTDDEQDDQQDYGSEDDQSQQDQSQDEQVQSQKQSQKSRKSSLSVIRESVQSKKSNGSSSNKIVSIKSTSSNKQNVHKWQHTCKNPKCPNKKPHKSHK